MIIRLLLLSWVVSGFLASPVAAQTQRRTTDPFQQLNDKVRSDLDKANSKVASDLSSDATSALQKFADFITGDMTGAADLAISIPDTLDGNGQVCFDAMTSAGKIFQANPIPKDTTIGIANVVERLRLLAMTVNKVCQLPACTQVFADATGQLSAIAPIKTPIPNLHDLCASVPTVAKANPTRSLTSTAPASTPGSP